MVGNVEVGNDVTPFFLVQKLAEGLNHEQNHIEGPIWFSHRTGENVLKIINDRNLFNFFHFCLIDMSLFIA